MMQEQFSAVVEQLARAQAPVSIGDRCEGVIRRIRDDSTIKLLAVVDSSGRPAGVLERQSVLSSVSDPLRYAVYQNRTVSVMMDEQFIAVESSMQLADLGRQLVELGVGLDQGGVIITREGAYHGILHNSDILDHMIKVDAARSRELAIAHEVVVDSVNYASRIQRGLLPSIDRMKAALSDIGILWEPRDVVGGDIYWMSPLSEDGSFWVGLIDCTGHGVPGAMVSMLVAASLERIYDLGTSHSPGHILAQLGDFVRVALNQDSEDAESNDGFDAAICKFDPRADLLTFAGARIGIFAVPRSGGEVIRINGSKGALGYKGAEPHLPLNEVELKMSDLKLVAMATDGIFDQPGGADRRAFGPTRWRDAIQSTSHLSPSEMVEPVRRRLEEWRGDGHRRDDLSAVFLGI
jgi:sigma-B regulation protein RsbU (phosphoserine phosphatase)